MGIILLDKNDKVLKSNDIASNYLQQAFNKGEYFGDIVCESDLDLQVPKKDEVKLIQVGKNIIRLLVRKVYGSCKDSKIGTLILIEDITDKQEIEEKERLLDKLTIAGELSASVAHEVRNPLTSIRGFVQLMHERYLKGKEDEFVEIVMNDIDHISTVLSEFISLAKPLRFDISDADISKIIDEAVLLEEANAVMSDITFIKNIKPVPVIKADAEKLKQAFFNIIHNAVQASKASSNINISVKHHLNYIIIDIQDYGVGLEEGQITKIFEPFYTTKKDGTGLGLAVAYRLITEVKGVISVSSTPKEGTLFTITIPAV